MCRKSEQDDSVYGADGRAAAAIVKKIDTAKKIDNQPRFRGMADTPNERLTTVLRASPPSPRLACAPLPPSR